MLVGDEIDRLIEDDPEREIFRVRKEAFLDRALFEFEMERIFEGTWIFIGLESQVRNPHDFLTTLVGRQPVIVMRDAVGKLRCFLNSCRHRGAIVCAQAAGNARSQICRYHGWSYDSGGRCIGITSQRDGLYPSSFANENHDLTEVAAFGNYRGLLFASLSAAVPPLDEHLGDARPFLDMLADQSPLGLEFVPGTVRYRVKANWKVSVENALDAYHFAVTHASYAEVMESRKRRGATAGPAKWVEDEPMHRGTFCFDRGHAVTWRNRNSSVDQRPLLYDPGRLDEIRARVGPLRTKWIMMNRNLVLFPNVHVVDISSIQMRVVQPLAVDETEIASYCVAPIGEGAEARRIRIRQYEDFFNPSGLATADDNVMFERSQRGYAAGPQEFTFGYLRGMAANHADAARHAAELGLRAERGVEGPLGFGDESGIRATYREWRRLLTAPLVTASFTDSGAGSRAGTRSSPSRGSTTAYTDRPSRC